MKKYLTLIFILLQIANTFGQTSSKPVVIELKTSDQNVAPGQKSSVIATFKVPKWIWLGASAEDARTPPGTSIKPSSVSGFNFEDAIFPEPFEEWVPAKLGKTKVYKELVEIVIPFTVDNTVKEGSYDVKFKINYTPGYNAGRMATHTNEEYTVKINVKKGAKSSTIPLPKNGSVPDDFQVKAKTFDDIPSAFKFMFNPLNEEKGITKALHKIWLDKSGHGKTVRFMPFPSFTTTNTTGTSIGMGASFMNATKEGTMTGMFSMSAYVNDLIGVAYGVQAISCPGAYHNYQFSAYFGSESFRNVTLHYENFTLSNSSLGIDVDIESSNEPRSRFYGLGPISTEEQETAYRQVKLKGILDVYSLHMQNLRLGLGVSYHDYDAEESFADIVTDEGIQFLQNSALSEGLIGFEGGSTVGVRFNAIYDHRDQEFSPSKGTFAKMTISRNSISDIETEDLPSSYYGLDLDMRQYFSGPSQKLVVLMRGALELKSESDLPFYQLSSLGGINTSRAYDADRYLGQHSVFASAEMRYTFFTIPVLGYPMSIEMGAFLDVGQVFGGDFSAGDDLNVDPGVSMRMINKPNVGVVLNYAYGSDGAYLSGGIGLPF